jgi:hypothetical protein
MWPNRGTATLGVNKGTHSVMLFPIGYFTTLSKPRSVEYWDDDDYDELEGI